ncbi:response regulator [Vibrio sp. JCM 19052]|nr:response regulator [Vibrio sp. JCM 19052]
MANYLQLKYQNYKFDGIIISDDAALEFSKRYLPNDERSVPLVAVGINNTQATLDSLSTSGSILYEQDKVTENIKLIIKLRPQIKNLYYLADRSMTSELVHARVVEEMKKFPQINLIELRDEPLAEAADSFQRSTMMPCC